MEVFIQTATSFPTVVFSALLLLMLLYWAIVIAGGLDVDALDGSEGASGALEAAEGGVKGGLDVLNWLTKKRLPMSVSASLVILAGWATSYLGTRVLLVAPKGVVPEGMAAWGVGAGAFAVGWIFSSAVASPLGPLFETHRADENRDLVGKSCRIQTGGVTADFGAAVVLDGASSDVIQVRFRGNGSLSRGDEALIVNYDADTNTFSVEPMTALAPKTTLERELDESN